MIKVQVIVELEFVDGSKDVHTRALAVVDGALTRDKTNTRLGIRCWTAELQYGVSENEPQVRMSR